MATARQTRPASRRPAASSSASAASRGATKAKRSGASDRLPYDVAIVFLIATALILLATLLWPANRGENVFGTAVVRGMRLVAGDGVWAFPVVLLFSGYMLGTQQNRSWDNIGGAISLFLIFLAWWHLGHAPAAAHFATDNLINYGGYIGAILSWLLRAGVGTIGGHIVLFALTVVAFLFLTDIPLSRLMVPIQWVIGGLAQVFRAGANAAVTGAQKGVERAAARRDEMRETAKRMANEAASLPMETAKAPASRPRLFDLKAGKTDREAAKDTPVAPTEEPNKPRRTFGVLTRTTPEPVVGDPVSGIGDRSAGSGFRDHVPEDGMPVADTDAPPVAAPARSPKSDPRNPVPATFALPPMTLLKTGKAQEGSGESEERREVLIQTLEDFGIGADIADVAHGPTLTRYEVALERGIKVSKIVSLADNLAMALAAIDVRIEAPIPGKSAIGIEVPNVKPALVTLRDCIERPEFLNAPSKLTFALGKDVTGACRYADLAKMPHLLIGGSTGSGKSSGLNALICSLLYRCTPRELKLLMVDPKKVELSLYDGIPHLAAPVITDVKQAPNLFKQAIREMEARYDKFAKAQTRNIEGYNGKVSEEEKLPYWVLIVDELADLMMTSGPEIETAICRLAQLARATGIHLVIATQRPSVNVITGTIKANISSRIAFAVNSAVDSRTILDSVGADRLLGRGDMLFLPMDAAKPARIQGCYVSEEETRTLVEFLKGQDAPQYEVMPSTLVLGGGETESANDEADDDLFESAVRLVVSGGSASTSMLQRRFKIGYTRAARLVDIMEQRGIVGPLDGAKPREIIMSRDEVEAMFGGPQSPDALPDDEAT